MKVFEYHQNTLCVIAEVLYQDLAFISYDVYKKQCIRKTLKKERSACPGRPALINYELLQPEWQEKIMQKHGDPYKTVKHESFQDFIVKDTEAVIFFRDYRYDENKALSIDKQKEYCTNVELLNTVQLLVSNRKARCKALGGKASRLWENISEVLNELDKVKFAHSLPTNPRSLQRALARFKQSGYQGIIHKNFGNTNSEKINPEAQLWVLSRWADRVKRVANTSQLLLEYNIKAAEKGWKKLEDQLSIYQFLFREDIQEMWWGHRYGELNAKEKFNYQHSTKMPTMRDSLWYSDGTKLNYFYQTATGKTATINVYEVMDAYSEVLLGYCISESEDYATQYSAYKMAVQFAGQKPYQLGFDNQGGHKKLTAGNFLSKISHLAIRTQPYNGKSKTIESAFNRFQSQYLKQDWFFTGQNIDAKKQESKANMEFILANQKNLPLLKEIKETYKQRRDEWNNALHHATGLPRIEMYLNSINDACPKVELWDMIDIFWVLRPEPIMYNAYGLSFTEKKQKYTYSVYGQDGLPDMDFHRSNIDKKFWIKMDPEDMGTIILFDKDASGNLRMVTEAKTKFEIVRGKQEQQPIDHSFIAEIKKRNDAARIDRVKTMETIQKEQGMDVESYGLNNPKIKGVNSSKKHLKKERELVKAKNEKSYAEFLKDKSELMSEVVTKDNYDADYYNDPTKYM